jgi:hypothetical protein
VEQLGHRHSVSRRPRLRFAHLAEPSRFEVRLRFENSELDLGPKGWPANGDFLLARVSPGGELVDLTDDDIRLWMFRIGLDYILHR